MSNTLPKRGRPKKVDRLKPDHLTRVRYVPPMTLEFTFADNFVGRLTLSEIGVDADEVDIQTAKATETALIFRPARGQIDFVIDSATLRYIADADYASRQDAAIVAKTIPSAQLERIARNNQPPQEWYDQPVAQE